jgi:hypothetical protein
MKYNEIAEKEINRFNRETIGGNDANDERKN